MRKAVPRTGSNTRMSSMPGNPKASVQIKWPPFQQGVYISLMSSVFPSTTPHLNKLRRFVDRFEYWTNKIVIVLMIRSLLRLILFLRIIFIKNPMNNKGIKYSKGNIMLRKDLKMKSLFPKKFILVSQSRQSKEMVNS